MTKNLTLFDTTNVQIEADVNRDFNEWVAYRQGSTSKKKSERALIENSLYVYTEMWQAFAKFCGEQNLTLPELRVSDLEMFLTLRGAGPDATQPRHATKGGFLCNRYANRYLTLIHRVTQFQAREQGIECNRAAATLKDQEIYKFSEAGDKDPAPEYLNEAQVKVLIAYITRAPQPESTEKMTWKTVRDRTAVALMLGAGLAPGDLRNLKVEGVISEGGRKTGMPWKLSLEGNGNSPGRETPIAEWAGKQLAFWLRIRAQQNIPGQFVFPSTMAGTQWSATRCSEASRAVLQSVKMGDAGGLFKLRHTFALRQLRHGKSEADVAKWLGFLDIESMDRYRRIVTTYQAVA